ncbi:MAG: hypothetical protein V1911_02730 [Candidatus Micrarchaeota archaeon]
MDHLAIMRKSWGLIGKILTAEKTIESRWYKFKRDPWNKIKQGDTVYFKDSGEPVTIKAGVSEVIQRQNLTSEKVRQILEEFRERVGIEEKDLENYCQLFKDKKYCILVFLKNPEKVEPFHVSKKGYGLMSAWITIDDINKLRKS